MTRASTSSIASSWESVLAITDRRLTAFLLWFLGFMVVGGEWFAMWQSEHWNGQQTAFRIYLTVLAVLIFIKQQDGDLAPPSPSQQTAPKRRRTDV